MIDQKNRKVEGNVGDGMSVLDPGSGVMMKPYLSKNLGKGFQIIFITVFSLASTPADDRQRYPPASHANDTFTIWLVLKVKHKI